ncbi:MAG: hypothetical protein KDC05_14990 [Bacteroidales bacterium]|nr:hypothetical protein [Bacteroidales bacterium]
MKYFYIQTLDKNNFVPNNDEFLVTDFKYKFYYLLQEELFTFVASPDSSKLLVYYDTPRDKSSREQFGFHVFDTELNVLWHEYKELLVNDLKYDIDRHVINNNGDVFLLGKTEKRNKGSEFTIYAFYNRGEGYTEYKVDFPGLITTEGQLSLSQDGKLICCGFYTRNDVDKIAGYWFVSFDTNTHEIVNSYHTEFDIDLITQNLTYKEEEKTRKKDEKGKNVDLANYEIRELIPATDGGYFLLGEQLIVQEKELLPAKHGDDPAIKIFYYYNDIVVLRLNSEGSLVWSQKIAKSQKSLNDGGYYSSYGVTSQNDNLYFVFNDNEKNLDYDGSGKVYTFRANQDDVAVVVKLDTEGAQKRTALFAIDKRDIVLRAKKCKEINSGEMIIYGEKKTTQRFARLIFN